jgi:hypothetical protein
MLIAFYGAYLVFYILVRSNRMNMIRYGSINFNTKIMILMQQDPVLVGLSCFLFLAGDLVFVFLISQVWGSVWNGRTGNEEEKWEDLAEAVKRGEVTEWPAELKEYNQGYGRKKRKGEKELEFDENEQVPLKSVKEIRNMYNRGVVGNLKEIIFPKRF